MTDNTSAQPRRTLHSPLSALNSFKLQRPNLLSFWPRRAACAPDSLCQDMRKSVRQKMEANIEKKRKQTDPVNQHWAVLFRRCRSRDKGPRQLARRIFES